METLRKRDEFLALYKSGERKDYPTLIIFYREGGRGRNIGFAVPKALGGAVERNRIRRRMKEVVRKNEEALPLNIECVLARRRTSTEPSFHNMEIDILRFIQDLESEKKE